MDLQTDYKPLTQGATENGDRVHIRYKVKVKYSIFNQLYSNLKLRF